MIKNFDNLIVESRYYDNYYYDGFQVNTDSNSVYFVQRDTNQNGRAVRFIRITVRETSNDVLIESFSDEGHVQLVRKQCPEMALKLIEEAKAEIRQVK